MRSLAWFSAVVLLSLIFFSAAVSTAGEVPPNPQAEGKVEAVPPSDTEDLLVKVPLGSSLFDHLPLAVVEDEQITMTDLRDALGAVHGGVKGQRMRKQKDYGELVRRLVRSKLILHEAQRMGLDELPEVRKAVEGFSRETLLEELQEQVVKDVTADEKEVDSLYRDLVRRWKVRSLGFEKEDLARKALEAIKAGKDFSEVASDFIASGNAKSEETLEIKPKDFLPAVAAEVSKLKEGAVSPVIKVESGGKTPSSVYVIVKLEKIVYPDDPAAREQARLNVVGRKKLEALTRYNSSLTKKYVKIDSKIFDSLDYNVSMPGIEKLLKDKRVLASIKGDKPITVADFSEALKMRFFHGMERAAETGRITKGRKVAVLEDMLARRTLRLEALKKGIDKSEAYLRKVKDYKESVLFGVFAQKVVAPDIKLSEDEVKQYYETHSSEYSVPKMLRLDGIALGKRDDAVDVFEKLKKGDDFRWLKEHTEGQVAAGSKGLLTFPESPVLENELPDPVQRSLSGAVAGDARLYASPEGYYYVIYVQELFPGGVKALDEVRDDIAKKVFSEKVRKTIDELGDKLAEHADVKVYVAQ